MLKTLINKQYKTGNKYPYIYNRNKKNKKAFKAYIYVYCLFIVLLKYKKRLKAMLYML